MLLNKQNLAVAEFASTEASRYNLAGIRVDHRGTAATNGHYAVMVTLPTEQNDVNFPCIAGFTPTNGSTPPFILSVDAAKQIAKAIPKKTTIPILNHAAVGQNAEGEIALAVTDLDSPQMFSPRKVEGTFPNLEAVMPAPNAETVLTIGLDAKYLAQLAKAAANFTDNATIKLKFYGPDRACTMEVSDSYTGQDWFAMLMPKRI